MHLKQKMLTAAVAKVEQTNLGYDDFFFEDFHGIIFPTGLFPDKDDFTKGSLSEQLQVVKVTHCLLLGNMGSAVTVRRCRLTVGAFNLFKWCKKLTQN